MLGVLGFSITAVLFMAYSATLVQKNKQKQAVLKNYRLAYILLGITFFVYAAGCAISTSKWLSIAVLVGNGLLLIATILMLNILLTANKYRIHALCAASALSIGMLVTRIFFFYPKPYMQDSMLIFNSQRFVSFTLSAAFLLVWLPVNLRIAQLVSTKLGQDFQRIYIYLYYIATFSAIIFMLSKKPLTLVMSFVALSLSFLLLVLSNLLINPKEANHHATK